MASIVSRPITVYLSSTLKDLEAERKAIKEILGSTCVVKESYDPSDASLVTKCLDDVGTCEVYIGVIGLRYGFIPPGQTKSITELEYDRATQRGLRRYVLIKNKKAVSFEESDAATHEHAMELIEAFRAALTSGKPDAPTPAPFSTVDELKLATQKLISDIRLEKSGGKTLLGGEPQHPWTITAEMAIGYVPGTDQLLKSAIEAAASVDQRVTLFDLSPALEHDYLTTLDAQVRRSRTAALLVSAASLSRIVEAADLIAGAFSLVRERSKGTFGILVDVTPDQLPPAVRAGFSDLFQTTAADWSAENRCVTFDKLQLWRRARAPEGKTETRVGLPYMVVALTASEAAAMNGDPDAFFKRFDNPAVGLRRAQFEALHHRLAQSPGWPTGFYGARRDGWRPFGSDTKTMNDFVRAAARTVNRSEPGSRERRLLRNAQLTLLPYAFDEYLHDRFGSKDTVTQTCELGCLVLLDEFALLHPELRKSIDSLLGSNNAAVVSINACDPTLSPLGELLADTSYLRIGNLWSRFSQMEDLRCELALNSAERLQRWLRLVLPELLTTLGQQQIDPTLVRNVEDLFEQPAGGGAG